MTKFRLGIDAFGGRKTVYGMIERPDGQVLLDGQPVRGHNALSQFLEDIVPEGLNGIVKITVHVALCRGEQVALGGEG